jgi:hypothetical protein
VEFTVGAGVVRTRWTLDSDDKNRVRNPDFQLRWVNAKAPDYWRFEGRRKVWLSDNIAVLAGKKYEIGPEGVQVEWMSEHWQAAGPVVEAGILTAPEKARYLRILIKGEANPTQRVAVREVD